VGIFGTFTGYLANLFLTPGEQRPRKNPPTRSVAWISCEHW
jgi:hypothetical protein